MRVRRSAKALMRRGGAALRRALRAQRPIVLMYHRVERVAVDPWRLAVTPSRFARQIALLGEARRIVPLSWLAAEIAAGRLPRRMAAVTFDDGYADVFRNASPVLEAAGCPATVFVTTGAVDARSGFWWDVLARIVLQTPCLPETLSIGLGGASGREFRVGEDRLALLASLHAELRPLGQDARADALGEIAAAAGTDADPRPGDLAMTPDEVHSLAAGGLIEIGAHTVTHPALTDLDAAAQEREIAASRRQCEELVGKPVGGFAYPYGDFDDACRRAVRAAGLSYACTTQSHAIRPGADALAIPRLLAADWDEDDFRREVLAHG